MEINEIIIIAIGIYLGIGAFILLLAIKQLASKVKNVLAREKLGMVLGIVFVLMASVYIVITFILLWPFTTYKTLKRMKNGN